MQLILAPPTKGRAIRTTLHELRKEGRGHFQPDTTIKPYQHSALTSKIEIDLGLRIDISTEYNIIDY